MTEKADNQEAAPAAGHSLRLEWKFLLALAAAGAVPAIYLLARLPLGIPGQWWYEYRSAYPAAVDIVLFLAAIVAFILAATAMERFGRPRGPWPIVICSALYFLVLFAGARCGPQGSAEFAAPALKGDAAGLFKQEAAKVDSARDYLQRFPQTLEAYAADYKNTVRVNNNPPGTTMLFYVAAQLADSNPGLSRLACELVFGFGFEAPNREMASAVIGSWALLLFAAMSFVPAALIARRLVGSGGSGGGGGGAGGAGGGGLVVAAFSLLAASLVLFVPGKDTAQVFLFLWMVYFWLRSWSSRGATWGALFGLLAAAAFFFSLATAVVVVVLLAADVFPRVSQNDSRGRLGNSRATHASPLQEDGSRGRDRLWFWLFSGGGLLLGFAIIWVGVGYNSFASLLACYRNHGLFYKYFPRTYWKWLLFNPVEFAVFFGGVPALMTVWALSARRRLGERLESVALCRALVAASLVVMVLLNVAGKNASEVARLWIFFMPLLALPAAALTLRKSGTPALALAALLQGMNLVLFRVLVDVWRVEALFDELRKVS